MKPENNDHTKKNLIWSGKDHQNITVNLYVKERDHILESHGEMLGNNFTAIYDSVEHPDEVYDSGEFDNRSVFFKKSEEATYYPRFFTKTIVEYNSEGTTGFIVTSMPKEKVGGNIGRRT